ncbi:peptidase s41 family protein [Drepanopeziza brunnea f. sp. 'multigermtubi' MB_m1]|uniref:Peptidase s41 family protein n=1 Tax=Marssonina brunnea f. sp. multigermtubi (strain MB_m1) TaxID=1072389 RepID=K1XHS9_MARBU|nr:peptidase s41 family protein [Drepanopeziza brunnea f. sp. 'multigermtubi' MB_m1]EKD20318.1 peptidase s41 family protein [Drepanopeziza brunnea f. sp. 'multigermtubi' MB_m1]
MKYAIPTTLLLTAAAATPTTTPPSASEPPCAVVSRLAAAQIAASPNDTPTVAAELAHDCLNSVPLNKTAAIMLVDAMVPYMDWQSDLAWKKNPPADYFYPPHDALGYLASVKSNLENNKYANEYKFQEDLYQVFARSHDGHFLLYPDAYTKAFKFGRQRSLVSISEDGTSLPVIKLYEDVISSPSTASVVSKINGVEASKYVADTIFASSLHHDPDAAYNSMFFEKAFFAVDSGTGYFADGGRTRFTYPGPNTTFEFANGTNLVTENVATVLGSFVGVTDGASFYNKFCTGSEVTDEPVDGGEEEEVSTEVVTVFGYPEPVLITNDTSVSGYYLDGEGFEDVAVLGVLSFESNSPLEFQGVIQNFFAAAKAAGKTKLVIDLSANGGGLIFHAYDLFRQLFPTIDQGGNSRLRKSDTLTAISEIYSAESADFDLANSSEDEINQARIFFNYRYDYNISNQPFESFQAKFGPRVIDGVNYTELMRWNWNDPLTSNATFGFGTDVTGYGSRTNFTQPFETENIIMLTEGFCGSTCYLFEEFMRSSAGVKSVVMGGRPQPGPMQTVGGVKGSQSFLWEDVLNYSQDALNNASEAQAAILRKITSLPMNRSSVAGLNIRDTIAPSNIDDGLPAQFVRTEADCRLFFTQDMITDVTAIWKAAAGAAFNGGKDIVGPTRKEAIEPAINQRDIVGPTRKEAMKPATHQRYVAGSRRDGVSRSLRTASRRTQKWLAKFNLQIIDLLVAFLLVLAFTTQENDTASLSDLRGPMSRDILGLTAESQNKSNQVSCPEGKKAFHSERDCDETSRLYDREPRLRPRPRQGTFGLGAGDLCHLVLSSVITQGTY